MSWIRDGSLFKLIVVCLYFLKKYLIANIYKQILIETWH